MFLLHVQSSLTYRTLFETGHLPLTDMSRSHHRILLFKVYHEDGRLLLTDADSKCWNGTERKFGLCADLSKNLGLHFTTCTNALKHVRFRGYEERGVISLVDNSRWHSLYHMSFSITILYSVSLVVYKCSDNYGKESGNGAYILRCTG